MESYIYEVNQTSLLNAEEEKELARAIAEGDPVARDTMIRANLRLVIKIARGYVSKGLGLQDMIEEGNLGLLHAVEYFDPEVGVRFSTYASYWIKQSITRALVNSGKTIRIPNYMVSLMNNWRKTTLELQDELGRAPTQEEVGAKMGLSKKKLGIITKAIRIHNNAGAEAAAEESKPTLNETLIDEKNPMPDVALSDNDELREVLALVENIKDVREKKVLVMRFGLDGEEPKTLKEIGDSLGLTRERVRQIEREALGKLRDRMDVD
jgi:RNA polymerase primary sigma factor